MEVPRCGRPDDLQVHHIQPRNRLGGDVEENLITLYYARHRQIHFHSDKLAQLDGGQR